MIFFPFFKPVLFSFLNPNSNMIQIKFKYSFKYTFKDENFWEAFKTKLLKTLLFSNSLFLFFSFISEPFSNLFSKAI